MKNLITDARLSGLGKRRGACRRTRAGEARTPFTALRPQNNGVEPNMMLLVEQESDIEDLGISGLGGTTADDTSTATSDTTEV